MISRRSGTLPDRSPSLFLSLLNKFFLSFLILLIVPSFSFSQLVYQVNFSGDKLLFQKKDDFDYVQLEKGEILEIEGQPMVPFRIINLLIPENKIVDTILCESETEKIPGDFQIFPCRGKEKTDGELPKNLITIDSSIYFSDEPYPAKPFELVNSGHLDENSILTLALYPLTYYPRTQNVILNTSIKLTILLKDASFRKIGFESVLGERGNLSNSFLNEFLCNPEQILPYSGNPEYRSPGTEQPIYLVITSEDLQSSFLPLIEWKTEKGLRGAIVTLDSIVNYYSGIDTQEKIRNFLIQSYPKGLLWVLLGGDGSIIPFRYAYHANTSTPIPITNQQICELYYADLDGEWDKDGDGVYGEPVDDSPDLYPELFVGRAPVKTKEEAEIFVQKVVNYEKNPGSGDYPFIQKGLWICSDQMRDWETVGQHTLASQGIDQSFYQDLNSLAESPSGGAENPAGPSGSKCIEVLNQGWGIIGIFAHGKSNGFVASSNLINQWPKTYVLSDSGIEDGNGHLNNLSGSNNLGVMYSISCNQTALDVETEPGLGTPPCMGKTFLISKDRGPVAFLGYSRWGWVSTSYKLASEFMKSLFKPEYGHHIGVAEAFSKTTYSVYRDLNYGHNLLGDPEMQIWTGAPCSLEVNSSYEMTSDSFLTVEVKARNLPLSDAKVVLSFKDTLFFLGTTDLDGKILVPLSILRAGDMNLTVTRHNFLPFETILNLSIKSDVKDEEKNLNLSYSLGLNYPNPFNPTTTIPFRVASSQQSAVSTIHTTLIIYNLLGQKVRTLVDEEKLPGNYQVVWNGKDQRGNDVSSGIYFYQLKAGDYQETRKMSLLR